MAVARVLYDRELERLPKDRGACHDSSLLELGASRIRASCDIATRTTAMAKRPRTHDLGTRPNVVSLPVLPPVPAPPCQSADRRQAQAARVLAGLAGQMGREIHLGSANLSSGFPASAVDIGALQSAIGSGVSRLTGEQLRRRWKADVRAWVQRLVLSWVQRVKRLTVTLRARGVHVVIQTQDDRGYYRYELDVFSRE